MNNSLQFAHIIISSTALLMTGSNNRLIHWVPTQKSRSNRRPAQIPNKKLMPAPIVRSGSRELS